MEKTKRSYPYLKWIMKGNQNTRIIFTSMLVLALVLINFSAYSFIQPSKYFTSIEIKKANTAINTKYLTVTEKEIFLYVNLARMYPKKFLKMYHDYADLYEGKGKLQTNYYFKTLTKELQTLKPVPALWPDKQMYETAKCWATEAGKAGVTGHNRKNCKKSYYAECCSYGSDTALDIIMALLIDEDVKSLGHRKICLSSSYALVGISKQPHSYWRTNTVLDFTYKNSVASK